MDLVEETRQFCEDGFVVVRGAFEPSEMAVVRRAIDSNPSMRERAAELVERCAAGGRPSFETIFVWNDTAGDDLFSLVTRSHRIFDRLEAYFEDEVFDYHNKVVLKYPGVVGFSYHQDYAYWYGMGNLFPDMATCFVAVTPATRDNGALKLIRGSHRCGRVDHVAFGDVADSGAEVERLEQIKRVLGEVEVELDAGDMVLFHANVLHGSEDNHSDEPRIALLGTYNTKHNSSVSDHDHPRWHRQERVQRQITEADAGKMPDFDLHHRDSESGGGRV